MAFGPYKLPGKATPDIRFEIYFRGLKDLSSTFAGAIVTSTGGTTICQGGSLILSTNPTPPGGSAYQWTKDNSPIAAPEGTGSTLTVNATGNYGLTVITNNVSETYPAITINVLPVPVAGFTHSANNLCSNVPMTFTSTSSGDGLTYSWNFGDPNSGSNNTSTSANPSHTFIGDPGNGTQSFNVTLIVKNNSGCTAATNAVVTVKQIPSTELGGTGSTLYHGSKYFTQCVTASATFNFVNQSTTKATNTHYTISWGDGSPNFDGNTFASSISHVYPVGVYMINYTVTGGDGCSSTETYHAFVGGTPAISMGTTGNNSICTGSTLTFQVAGGTNPPGTTYTVTYSDGFVKVYDTAPDTISHTFNISSNGKIGTNGTKDYLNAFSASIDAENPCGSTSASVVPIYVSDKPKAKINVTPSDTVCIGTSQTFSNANALNYYISTTGQSTLNKFVWRVSPSNNDYTVSGDVGTDEGSSDPSLWTSGDDAIRLSYKKAGTYTIKLKAGNPNCGLDSITKTVCVNPTPVAAFNLDNSTGCAPMAVKATNSSLLPFCGNNTYLWEVTYNNNGCTGSTSNFAFANGTNKNSTNPEFNFINPGRYTIRLTTTSPGGVCSNFITKTVTVKDKPIVTLTSAQSVCQAAAYTPFATVSNCHSTVTATYAWTMPGASVTTSSSLNPGIVTYNAPGTYTITLAVTNECGTTTKTQTVTVNETPTVTAPADQQVCVGANSGPLNFTSSPGTTFRWTNSNIAIGLPASGTGNIGSFIARNTSTSPIAATITVTPTNGSCPGQPATFKITVYPIPAAPLADALINYCINDTPVQLTATASAGNTLTWYNNATLTGGSTTAPTPATSAAVSVKYYVTQSNAGGCPSPATAITVNVYPAITNNTISSNQSLCANTSAAALTSSGAPGGGSGTYAYQWQSSADGTSWANVTGATSASYNPGNMTATTLFRRIITSGNCSNTSNAVTITVQGSLTNFNISTDQTICRDAVPALLKGQDPAGASGSFTFQWESSANGSTFNLINGATAIDYQPAALTATTYFRRVTFGGTCNATSNVVTVTVNPKPVVNPVSDKVLCNASPSGSIAFSAPTANTSFNWVNDNTAIGLASSGAGNIPSFVTANTGKTPITANITVTPIYTSGGESCPGTPLVFKITILPTITLASLPGQTVCTGSLNPAVIPVHDAAAFAGSSVSYSWNSNAPIGISNGSGSQVPSFTATNTGTADRIATITVTPEYNYQGMICSGTPVSYTVTVYAAPTTAQAGPNAKTCGTGYQLQGNAPVSGTGAWSQTAGAAATFSSASAPNATLSNLVKGTRYQFSWAISNGSCTPSTSPVIIDVLNDITNTIKVDAPFICPGQSAALSTAQLTGGDITGVVAASYTYEWESSANGSTGWQTISGATQPGLTVSPSATVYYRRKVKSYQQCEFISNVITVTLNSTAPAANAGSTQTLCAQTQTILAANNPGAGFTGTWTDAAGQVSNLTFSPNANTYNATVSGLVPGRTYKLTWTIASSSCGFTSSDVTLDNLLPIDNQVSPATTTICAGQTLTITGNTPTGGTAPYTFAWESSSNQTNWQSIPGQSQQNLTVTPAGSLYYRRIVFAGSCSLASASASVVVLPAIGNNTISASQQVCINKPVPVLSGSSPTGGDGTYTYQWQQSADNTNWVNIGQATQPNYQPQPLLVTTYYRRMVTSAMCSGNQQNISAPITITVNPNAKAEFNASKLKGCVPFDLNTVITSVPHEEANGQYQWFANGTPIGTGANFPGYILNTDGGSVTIRLLAISKFGCDTNSVSLTFSTTKSVVAAFTKDKVKDCGPLPVRFTNTSAPLNGATYRWDFGDGQTSSLVQPGVITFQPNPFGRDTTYHITLTAATDCSSTVYTDSVTVRARARAVFTPDKTIGCSPFTVHITNQSTGLPNTYILKFGNGQQVAKSDNSPIDYTYITDKTDTLTMTLVAENECGKDSSSYKIVVYPNSVKANLVVNGDNKFGCAPFAVKFDNNSTGANTFKYDFGDGNTATTTSAPESVFHTFTRSGTYVVKLTASNGCSTQSTTQTITVIAQPAVSFNPVKLEYCVRDSVAFTNTTAARDSFDYVWDFGDGSAANGIAPKHVYKTPGTYTVKLTAVQNAANGATCASTASRAVTILPLPVATFNSNSATLNCAPFSLTVSSTPANASGGVSWSFGDAGSSDNTASGYTASHRFTKPGLYLVTLRAYNQSGCVDSTSQVVRVTETPLARFIAADTVLCGNSATVAFKNQSTYGGNDQVNYKWYVNDTYVSAQKDLTYNFSTPSTVILPYTFRVKLIASSTIGCPDTVEHTMRFNPIPVAAFSAGANISCAPYRPVISNTSTYSDGFKWYVDNVLVSTDRVPANIILTKPNTTYSLKLVTTNIYACRADSITKTVSTYPSPVAAFSLADSVSCNGRLDIRVTNATSGATTYTWNFGDGSPEQTGRIPAHTYGIPGVYRLSLVAFNGTCRDTATHEVHIAAPPKAAFVASVLKGCTGISPVFQNTSVNASTYLWDFGDGTFSTSKNPTHQYTYTKSPYTVKLVAYGEFGCADSTVIVNYITVSAPPVVDFAALPDSVVQIPNYTFNFKNETTGSAVKYLWEFGDGKTATDKDPAHTYKDPGTYQVKLTVTNADGCTASRTRTVKVAVVEQYLYVPNAFEPGSSRSELQTFTVRAAGLVSYSLKIFNKWGQLLFQTTELDSKGTPMKGWAGDMAGRNAPTGVYVWQITGRFLDGTEWHGMKYKTGDKPSQTGILHLIR
ncbi:PKD domain-containing protein [Mucilaginibacter pedocola]|nr:PKD domain-containing protein [Mucilaginibacter pedocola]